MYMAQPVMHMLLETPDLPHCPLSENGQVYTHAGYMD